MDKNREGFNIPEKQFHLSSTKIWLALFSGVLLTASFPPLDITFVAWFALVPLLKSIHNETSSQAFKLGFITGTIHYLTLIYWIIIVLGRYGNLNFFLSFFLYLLLCFYLAMYPALFSLLTVIIRKSRLPILMMGCFWIGLEFIRAKLLTGFPWCLLGYTQYRHPNLIQVADLFGVYGLSFLIILINGLIYSLLFRRHNRRNFLKHRGLLKWELIVVLLIAGGTLAYGYYRLLGDKISDENLLQIRTVVIQGNIDQSLKWDPAHQSETIATYQRLTRSTYEFKPELIVWPETAVPFFFQHNAKLASKVTSVLKESGAILVFGSPAFKQSAGMTKYYNRAYLLTTDEKPLQYYDKVHLVPFGEYVPLKKLLYFINRLVPAAGDFESGDEIITLNHDRLSIGVMICFEAIFPEVACAYATKGANILINITNDAWFGKTSAPYQHLAMCVFRAVENRMPIIRAANTGFSAFIMPQGKIMARGKLFSEETLKTSLKIVTRRSLTFYARFGFLLAPSLLGISFVNIVLCLWNRRVEGRNQMR